MTWQRSVALVIKGQELAESDGIFCFFTQRFGKLWAVAKGVRGSRSKLAASLQPLTLVELIYLAREGRSLARIISCDILHPFARIKGDFEKIKRGYYVLELVDIVGQEGVAEPEIFAALTRVLYQLEEGQDRGNVPLRLFEWQLLSYSGFRPQVHRCMICQDERVERIRAIDIVLGGAVCEGCSHQVQGIEIGQEALSFMRKALGGEPPDLEGWVISVEADEQLGRVAEEYLSYHFGRELRSREFLHL